jgi:hypothetical protein
VLVNLSRPPHITYDENIYREVRRLLAELYVLLGDFIFFHYRCCFTIRACTTVFRANPLPCQTIDLEVSLQCLKNPSLEKATQSRVVDAFTAKDEGSSVMSCFQVNTSVRVKEDHNTNVTTECKHCVKAGLQCEYPANVVQATQRPSTSPHPQGVGDLRSTPGIFVCIFTIVAIRRT